jgi:hypothetical protein
MRNRIIAIVFAAAVVWGSLQLGNDVVVSADFYLAILVGVLPAIACGWIISRSQTSDRPFLLRVFVAALAVRYFLAYVIYTRNLQAFLGGDALTYDGFGYALAQSWKGLVDQNAYWLVNYSGADRSGFGMFYFVAGVYYAIGQNPFAIQLINCAFGAAVCVIGYKITMRVYPNIRVARVVALMTAFSPSLVLWTSQQLKDGPIVLFLCLCILFTLKICDKFEAKSFIFLLASLGGLYTLRHYMSYIMFAAVAGALLFSIKKEFSPLRMLQGATMVIAIGFTLSYFGAADTAKKTLDIERVQKSREWNAKAAASGFGGDVDITDPNAAIEFLPVGVLYVLLAPFPWMISSFRQLITLPELMAWWLLMPMMIRGFWHTIRNNLRKAFVICTFVVSTTLAFALFESNAGTAYRHRSQLYVFFFVFMAIGLELRRSAKLEKRRRMQPIPLRPLVATPMSGRLRSNTGNFQTMSTDQGSN